MVKRIKLLAIVPTFYPMMGGAERSFYEVYSGLARKGYKIELITPNSIGAKRFERIDGINVYRVGPKIKHRVAKFLLYQFFEYLKIRKFASKHYDIAHVSYGLPSCFVGYWLKRKYKLPLVVTEHHYGTGGVTSSKENPFFVNLLLAWFYSRADVLVATGKTQKSFLESLGMHQVKIIPNGVSLTQFHPKFKTPKIKEKYNCDNLVLTVSRLDKRKNIGDLIKAARYIKTPNTKVIIGGKGPEYENLANLIKHYRLESKVILAGFIHNEELPKYYASADIFALTSKYEGFGIVFCEALASGTPVVTYEMEASKDILMGKDVGIVTKPNPIALAEAIDTLLGNRKLIESYRKNAREYARKFSWSSVVSQYDKLFRSIIKN